MALALTVSAQLKVGTQFGGANFFGFSAQLGYEMTLSDEKDQSLELSAGIGLILPPYGPNSIVNAQVNYYWNKWGVGLESGWHEKKPFYQEDVWSDGFANLLLYPKLIYQLIKKEHLFINLSAGPYFAFDKRAIDSSSTEKLVFEGDVIPGIGINLGYRL